MACSHCGAPGHNRTTCPKRQAEAPPRPEAADHPPGLSPGAAAGYTPALWEKVTAVGVAVLAVGLVGWLVVRNERFADPNLVVLLRVVISLAVAVLGATVPGFAQVGWDTRGVTVRAGGALALFVTTYLLSPSVVTDPAHRPVTRSEPTDPKTEAAHRPVTKFELVDAMTGDGVYRPLTVTCRVGGRGGAERLIPLVPECQGRFDVEAAEESVEILKINCPGYSFARKQSAREQGVVVLSLDRARADEGTTYSAAITPPPKAVQRVAEADHQRAVKDQVIPEGGVVNLRCVNKSRYHLTLLLYRQNDELQAFQARPWTVLQPTCPGGSERTCTFHETAKGSYYYVFASILGLDATQLVGGNLLGTPTPVLEVFELEKVPHGPVPALSARLVAANR